MRRVASLVLPTVLAALASITSVPASAAPPDYVLATSTAPIEDEDGQLSITLSFINLTDRPAIVALTTDDGGGACSPSTEELDPRRQEELTFSLDECDFGDRRTVALTADVEGVELSVAGRLDDSGDPEWALLWTFAWTLGAGIVAVLLGWAGFRTNPPVDLDVKPRVRFGTPLPYLGATWSFKDSWAANVTLVSAVFTGLFGSSELLTAATGDEAKSTVALITIASAIGVALVGLGPLILQAARSDKAEVYAGGLFASAAVAVGASGGLALVIVRAVSPLVDGLASRLLWTAALLGLLLLAVYAVTSVRQNLTTGLTKPASEETGLTGGEKQAIAEVVSANVGGPWTPERLRQEVIPDVEDAMPPRYPERGTSRGDLPAALI